MRERHGVLSEKGLVIELALQFEDSGACHQVGPGPDFLAFLQAKAVDDFQMILQGQLSEIGKRPNPNVGRVVPLEWQSFGDGHPARQNAQTVGPVRKIWERQNTCAAHTNRLAQHHLSVAQMLKRVDLQNHIKGLVCKHVEAFVQIQLNDIDAAFDTSLNVPIVNLNAIA